MEEEASTSLISGLTPWPAGLQALEEQKEKEKEGEEREREATRPPQEQQQQQQHQQEQQQQQQQQTLEGQQQQQQQGAKRTDHSSPRLKVWPNRYHWRRKSPASGRKICWCTALQPQRGSSRGRPPRSGRSRGEQTEWWHSPA